MTKLSAKNFLMGDEAFGLGCVEYSQKDYLRKLLIEAKFNANVCDWDLGIFGMGFDSGLASIALREGEILDVGSVLRSV